MGAPPGGGDDTELDLRFGPGDGADEAPERPAPDPAGASVFETGGPLPPLDLDEAALEDARLSRSERVAARAQGAPGPREARATPLRSTAAAEGPSKLHVALVVGALVVVGAIVAVGLGRRAAPLPAPVALPAALDGGVPGPKDSSGATVRTNSVPETTATKREPPARPAAVVLLPAGPFAVGCAAGDPRCEADEARRTLELPAIWIDATEVTASAYDACAAAGACPPAKTGALCTSRIPAQAAHPINCVDAAQAEAYCRYAKGRLPTDEEWEKAARCGGAVVFPWGAEPPSCARANLGGCKQHTAPVGAYPASACGLHDLAGNVWEWTATARPAKKDGAPHRSIRGGSFYDVAPALRASNLGSADPRARLDSLGLRCVYDRAP